MDFDDEDYEISSKIVEEYASQFRPSANVDFIYNQSKNEARQNEEATKDFNNNNLINQEQNVAQKMRINSNLLKFVLGRLHENILFDVHREFLLSLSLMPKQSSPKLSTLLLIVPILSCLVLRFYFALFSLILACWFLFAHYEQIETRVYELFYVQNQNLIANCVDKIKQLTNYLKQVEQIHLSGQRELIVLSKKKLSHINESSDLNFKYRKQFFHKCREHFFKMRSFNQNLVELFQLCEFFDLHDNLVCTIELKDLSKILHDNQDLDSLTDNFSLDCIKSLTKLNQFLMSESFHLLILVLIIRCNLYKKLASVFKFFNTYRMFLKDFEVFDDFLKLTNKNSLNTDSKNESEFRKQGREIIAAKNLGLYLRNCLLNVFDLIENRSSNDLDTLLVIKQSFNNANLYLNQLETILDKEFRQTSEIGNQKNSNLMTAALVESANKNVRIVSHDFVPVIEDEIFEAEMKNEDLDLNEKSFDEIEQLSREKENHLLSKNLYYELKYALKTKSIEWTQREKRLKKNGHHKKGADSNGGRMNENELGLFVDENDEEASSYLLENDALKYKAQLKCRRVKNAESAATRFNVEDTASKKKNKYAYYDNTNDLRAGFSLPSRQFLSDFMQQRSLFFSKTTKSEDVIGDEEDFEEL